MKLIYAKDIYVADGTLAIRSYVEEDGWIEPYGPVTVCLTDYGLKPDDGYIYMPTYKMTPDYTNQVIDDIVEEIIGEVRIGYGTGLYVKLKDDWEKGVSMMDWI